MASQDPSQNQDIGASRIEDSELQLLQGGRDTIGFLNSHENQVTINKAIVQLFGRSQTSGADWDWAHRLLVKKQLPDIRKRLSDVLLQNRTLMEVSIEEQLAWVNRSPLEAERRLQIGGEDRGTIEHQLLIETFGRDDVAGKLLILGAPGAGKTTALLGLAEQLVIGAIAQPKTVIPALFELSTWRDDNQSIEQWLIEQLYELHGGNRKAKLYEQWVERQVLLPLLDGLDELGLDRQTKCTQKLNEFARHYPQLVVCCRVKEFETVGIKLGNLNGAVCLQPLSDRQIQDYLDHVGSDLWNEIKTVPAMKKLMQPTEEGDPGLLRIPLFISLAAQVYDSRSPFESEAELLGRYVEWKLSKDVRESDRRKDLAKKDWAYKTVEQEPTCTETKRYLSWIARQLQQRNQVELLIEKMQPSWLETTLAKKHYQLAVGLLNGVLCGLVSGLVIIFLNEFVSGKSSKLYDGLFVGLFFGLTVGFRLWQVSLKLFELLTSWLAEVAHEYLPNPLNKLIGRLVDTEILELGTIEPVENLQISASFEGRQRFFNVLFKSLLVGLYIGLISMFNKDLSLRSKVITGLIGLILGLLFGLEIGLISALKQELKLRTRPNQGIRNSLQSFIWTTIFSYVLSVSLLIVGSALTYIAEQRDWVVASARLWSQAPNLLLFPSLLTGIFTAFIVSFFAGGGVACIQHFCLRIILTRTHTVPWNVARFLNYCTERRLLQRIGGRYRFLHRELLDHFATLRF